MEPIQVEFTFTADSFGKAQVHIMFRYLKTGWLKWILLFIILLWLGSTFYFGGVNWLRILNILTWVPLFLAVWWVMFRWLSRRNFSKFPMLQHPIRYTFTKEKVNVKTQSSEAVLQWENFTKAEEASSFFLLYQNAFMASPLLKSGFQSETDQEKFRELLRSKNLLSP
ncbi:MAG: YcxB family protein [Saprospiraceae bacterium]